MPGAVHHPTPKNTMQIDELKKKIGISSITEVVLARAPNNQCPGWWFMWVMAAKRVDGQIITFGKKEPVAFVSLDEAIELLSSFGYDGQITVAWERGMTCN